MLENKNDCENKILKKKKYSVSSCFFTYISKSLSKQGNPMFERKRGCPSISNETNRAINTIILRNSVRRYWSLFRNGSYSINIYECKLNKKRK